MAWVSDILNQAGGIFNDGLALNVLILSIVLAVVSLFIWEFYKSTSKRNLIHLNLRQYNTSEHPILSKLFAIFYFFIEYILIMPLLITLWFSALSFMLLLIAEEGTPVGQVLLIAAVVIGGIRILAYFKGEIAKDVAKMFPFIALSIFILTLGNSFNLDNLISQARIIPSLVNHIFSFVLIIFFIEIVLRVFYTVYELWASEGGEEEVLEEVLKKQEKAKEEEDEA